MTSNRETHSFLNSAKADCRAGNLAFLREHCGWAFDDEGRMVCTWAELMGESGDQTLALLETEQVLKQGGFVGIDLDKKVIQRHKAARPDLHWIVGDLFNHTSQLRSLGVGVINLDGYNMAGHEAGVGQMADLKPVIADSVKRFGGCAVFWNVCLDATRRHRIPAGQAFMTHADNIRLGLSNYLPECEIGELLPLGAEQQVNDGFEGELGAFYIYRGKERGLRMANLRLVL